MKKRTAIDALPVPAQASEAKESAGRVAIDVRRTTRIVLIPGIGAPPGVAPPSWHKPKYVSIDLEDYQ